MLTLMRGERCMQPLSIEASRHRSEGAVDQTA